MTNSSSNGTAASHHFNATCLHIGKTPFFQSQNLGTNQKFIDAIFQCFQSWSAELELHQPLVFRIFIKKIGTVLCVICILKFIILLAKKCHSHKQPLDRKCPRKFVGTANLVRLVAGPAWLQASLSYWLHHYLHPQSPTRGSHGLGPSGTTSARRIYHILTYCI